MVPLSNYYLDSDDPTAKAPVIIDDPEDKEILKGYTKILEVRVDGAKPLHFSGILKKIKFLVVINIVIYIAIY